MEKSYKLRLTLTGSLQTDGPSLASLQDRYFKSFIRATEQGKQTEKPHYHYYFSSIQSKVNIRQWIQNNLGKGNGVYSLIEFKESPPQYPWEYLSYLYKEDPSPITMGVDTEIIDKVKCLSVETAKRVSQRKKGGKINELRELIIKKHGRLPTYPSQLVHIVLQVHLDEGWIISKFRITDYVQTILCQECPDYLQRFERQILDKLD